MVSDATSELIVSKPSAGGQSTKIKSKLLISANIDLKTNSLFSKFVSSTSAAAKSVFAPIIFRPGINVSFIPSLKVSFHESFHKLMVFFHCK